MSQDDELLDHASWLLWHERGHSDGFCADCVFARTLRQTLIARLFNEVVYPEQTLAAKRSRS